MDEDWMQVYVNLDVLHARVVIEILWYAVGQLPVIQNSPAPTLSLGGHHWPGSWRMAVIHQVNPLANHLWFPRSLRHDLASSCNEFSTLLMSIEPFWGSQHGRNVACKAPSQGVWTKQIWMQLEPGLLISHDILEQDLGLPLSKMLSIFYGALRIHEIDMAFTHGLTLSQLRHVFNWMKHWESYNFHKNNNFKWFFYRYMIISYTVPKKIRTFWDFLSFYEFPKDWVD